MAPLAYLAPLGLAPLAGLLGLACLPARRAPLPWPLLAGLGALLSWAAVSLLWSPVRPWMTAHGLVSAIEHVTLLEVGVLALTALSAAGAALAVDRETAAHVTLAFRWSILVLAILLGLDSLAGGRVYATLAALVRPAGAVDFTAIWAARGGYVLAVVMWPWLAGLPGRARWMAPVPFLAVTAVSVFLRQDAPLFALIAGSAAFALVLVAGVRGLAALGAAQTAFWLSAPWIVQAAGVGAHLRQEAGAIKPSWAERLRIWRFASDRVAEHPWRGWGMDASRSFGDTIPLHPHNWPLQVWLELGVPGAVIVTGLSLGMLRGIAGLRSPIQRAAAAGAMSAYLAVGAVSFGLWQSWWLAVGVLAGLGLIVVCKSGPDHPRTVAGA
jgi:O-antigen ligase